MEPVRIAYKYAAASEATNLKIPLFANPAVGYVIDGVLTVLEGADGDPIASDYHDYNISYYHSVLVLKRLLTTVNPLTSTAATISSMTYGNAATYDFTSSGVTDNTAIGASILLEYAAADF